MSEETENEERRLQGLGEIPEGREDPGQAFWSPEPDPMSGEAIDLIAQQTIRPDVPGVTRDFDRLQAEQDSIQVGGEVKSVYSTRPINGFDTLIGGLIEMTVASSASICTIVSDKPVAPFTFDFGSLVDDVPETEANQQFSGCALATYAALIVVGRTFDWSVWDAGASPGTYNFYLFDSGGTLVDSSFGVTIPSVETVLFSGTANFGFSSYVLVCQGVDSDDVSNATVNVKVLQNGIG